MSVPRTSRLAGQIRAEASEVLAREVHDPGIGFVTLTRVQVTPDLQLARLYYTTLGDPAARRATERALERATPFLRRQLGSACGSGAYPTSSSCSTSRSRTRPGSRESCARSTPPKLRRHPMTQNPAHPTQTRLRRPRSRPSPTRSQAASGFSSALTHVPTAIRSGRSSRWRMPCARSAST